jgi:outer membrane usher protein
LTSTAERLARALRRSAALGLGAGAVLALCAEATPATDGTAAERQRIARLAAALAEHRPRYSPVRRPDAPLAPAVAALPASGTLSGWLPWTLAVTIDGRPAGQGVAVLEAPDDGRLAVALSAIDAWQIPFDRTKALTAGGRTFVPLDAVSGIEARLDPAAMTLALALPAGGAASVSDTAPAIPVPTATLLASTLGTAPAGPGARPQPQPRPTRQPPAVAEGVDATLAAAVDDATGAGIEQLEAIEPAAGITFRRDPIEPPLLEQERWIEWVLSVILNGRPLGEAVVVIEEPESGRLAIELAVAESWRLLIDRDRILAFEGVPFLPLDSVDGITIERDLQTLELALEIPAEAFAPSSFDVGDGGRLEPTPGTGAFLDYDLVTTGGGSVSDQLDGLFEAGLFAGGTVLIGNLRVEDATADPDVQRLETTLSRDFPDRRATFRFGDSLTVGGAFAQGLRFGGLQWSTNFATDPAFVTFPLPTIGGLAEQDSVVDVIVDNLTRATESVPPGPFAIDNVPVVTGGGEVQLRVTDLLGRERLITQSYYVSTRLLKQGLGDFSYEAGFRRRDFGGASFDYGDPLATATHRYGFTDGVTGEVHAEVEKDRLSLVAGGALLLGPFGVLTGGAGGSADEDAGEGVLGQVAYEYLGRRFSIGARTRYTSDDFRQAAGDDGRLERVDQFNIGYDALALGRLGLLFLNQERNDGENQRSVSASYSLPIGPGSLVLNAARTVEPERDYAITAAYSVPLGPNRSMTGIGRLSESSNRARLQYTRTRGASELGLDYRLATEVGDDNRPVDARLGYQTRYFGTDANIERFSGDNRFRLGVNGSASVVDGHFALSRRIGRSFGLVDLPGFPNVRVFLDNREAGTTDARGRLLLPSLRPYEANRISLAVDDLPLSADLVTAETAAVPYDRSGMTIDFGIVSVQRATVTLLDGADRPLPAGHTIRSDDGALEALIGRDGFTQLSGDLGERRYLAGSADGRRFVCALPPAPPDDPMPHLGDVRCAE